MMQPAMKPVEEHSPSDIIARIGSLTRMLRDSLRELGLDQAIAEAAEAIPDARDRLDYVVQMTAQAAERALNSVEASQPHQDAMEKGAKALTKRWDEWFENPIELADARELVTDTRQFLGDVPGHTSFTNAQRLHLEHAVGVPQFVLHAAHLEVAAHDDGAVEVVLGGAAALHLHVDPLVGAWRAAEAAGREVLHEHELEDLVARSRLHLDGEHVADDGLVLTRLIADALGELERLGLLGLRSEEVVEETVERDADEAEVREGHEPVDRALGVLARVLAQPHDHAGVEGGLLCFTSI